MLPMLQGMRLVTLLLKSLLMVEPIHLLPLVPLVPLVPLLLWLLVRTLVPLPLPLAK